MTDHHRQEAALSRALSAVMVDEPLEAKARRDRLAPLRPGNMVQATQLPISGEVSAAPASMLLTVTFEHPFLSPLTPDDSDLELPHFTSGIELQSGDAAAPAPGDGGVVIGT